MYQPYLSQSRLAGYPDLLVRVDPPSRLGNFSYEVIDSKLSKNEKALRLIQLCFAPWLMLHTRLLRLKMCHTTK